MEQAGDVSIVHHQYLCSPLTEKDANLNHINELIIYRLCFYWTQSTCNRFSLRPQRILQ